MTVGDAGNEADTTSYGAVGYEFQIQKFEFTNGEYVEFLNAVGEATRTESTRHRWEVMYGEG